MVCNVHWLSDTEAGMAVGAATFARLQNNPLFQATMTMARLELEKANLQRPESATCDSEATALASLQKSNEYRGLNTDRIGVIDAYW